MYRNNRVKRIKKVIFRQGRKVKGTVVKCCKKTARFLRRTGLKTWTMIKRAARFVWRKIRRAGRLFLRRDKRALAAAGAVVLAAAIVLAVIYIPIGKAQIQKSVSKAEVVAQERHNVFEEGTFKYDPLKALDASNKNEMVVITCDANGKNEEISDRVTLSGFSTFHNEAIKDETNLTNIENIDGEEAFVRDGNVLYWQNMQKDIVYEGLGTKEPPVKVRIKYYLDGKEVSTESLEGKSGRVRIEISFENKTKGADFVPYSATTLLTLDKEAFTNIQTNGSLVESGFNVMIYKSSFPGLEENLSLYAGQEIKLGLNADLTIEADVKEFTMGSAVSVVTNGTLANLDDSKLESITNSGDIGSMLSNYSYQLASGASDLVAGLGIFKEGLNNLSTGSGEFTVKLQEYLDGITTLRAGLGTLVESVSFLPEVSAILQMAQEYIDGVIEYLRNLGEKAACLDIAIAVFRQKGDNEMAFALEELQIAIYYPQCLIEMREKIIECLENASMSIQSAYEQMDAFYNGIEAANNGAISLEEASGLILEAQTAINNGIDSLKSEFGKIENGGASLQEGAWQFSYSVSNAGNLAGSQALSVVINRLKELKIVDQKCHSYSGALPVTKGSATYMFKIGAD